MGKISKTSCLYALLVAFVLLGFTYSFITPLYEAPDEVGHFLYVCHMLIERSLPVQELGRLGEAHQPPLYYAIGALVAWPANLEDQAGLFLPNPQFMWAGAGGNEVNISLHGSAETFPFRGYALAFHLVRLVSVLMGAVTVVFTVLIGWKVFPDQPQIGLLAGALVAFNPQFLFISSAVNNDNLLNMLYTIGTWQLLRTLSRPEEKRQWVYIGLLIGASFLAKINGGLVIGAVAGLVLLYLAFERRSSKFFFEKLGIMVAFALLVSGWWFVRNQVLYGDPLGYRVFNEVFAVVLRQTPLQWQDIRKFLSVQFHSFWGKFGWMNVSSPYWLHLIYRGLTFAGLLGLGFQAFYHVTGKRRVSSEQLALSAWLAISAIAQEAYMVWVITRCIESCYQGRYLFAVIAPLMILLSWGLMGLLPQRRWTWLRGLALGGLGVGLAALAIFVPFKVIAPAYKIVPLPQWRLWTLPYKTDFDVNGLFKLKGYALAQTDVSDITLTLYWQATHRMETRYSVSVEVLDADGQVLARQEHVPGEDQGYPPTRWLAGDILADAYRFAMPAPLSGPYRFRIAVYDATIGQVIAVGAQGQAREFIVLDQHLP